jgi:hypothetical protein
MDERLVDIHPPVRQQELSGLLGAEDAEEEQAQDEPAKAAPRYSGSRLRYASADDAVPELDRTEDSEHADERDQPVEVGVGMLVRSAPGEHVAALVHD